MKLLFYISLGAIGIFVTITLYLYFNQRSMIFFPYKDFIATPNHLDLKYMDVVIPLKKNQSIHGWYIEPTDTINSNSDKVILFCHGNAGNISHRLPTLQFLNSIGFKTLIFDYRGYGQSKGELSEESVYQDAEYFYNWLINNKNIKPENIVIFGRSLGGAVAIDLALKVACHSLIIESSFTSAADMGKKIFPFFPIKYILKYKFDSISKVEKLKRPILIIHSPDDDIIPYEMGEKLYEKASQPKRFLKISGLHNDLSYLNDPEYARTIQEFVGMLSE